MKLAKFGKVFRDRRGVAMVEFALAGPVFIALSLYGLESTNYALAHLRVSQIAGNLADTVSRIGENSTLSEKTIRETDINDAFQAVRLQSASLELTTRGRIILSSLERNAQNGQWIHWQRCLGTLRHNSTFGVAGAGRTGTGFPGMGTPGDEIQAPAASAIMFVEIAYRYKPLINDSLLGAQTVRAKSAFLVRERRDLDPADNPSNPAPAAVQAVCTRFAA